VFSQTIAAGSSAATGVVRRAAALRLPVGLPALVLVLATVLAGCGSSDNGVASKPASEILAASKTAAKSASSVRISSTTKTGPSSTSTFKLELGSDSGRAAYSLLGLRFEVLRTGGSLYVRGNKTFRERLGSKLGGQEGANAAAKLPASTWVKVPAGSSTLTGLGELTNIGVELPRILAPAPVVKGHETVVDGQKAVTLKESTLRYTGTLYIATTGEPYPIQLVKHGRQTGKMTFSGWNDPLKLSAPTNTIDISTLEGKGH
jgi:hypothetical protein